MITTARLLGGGISSTLGYLGIEQVTSNGPDLAGIALIITAVSGFIATVGALVIGLRKKPTDPALELALELLRRDLNDDRAEDQ